MALTKIQLVESIHNQIGFTQKRSSEIVETLLEIIKGTLASGEDVDSANSVLNRKMNEEAETRLPVKI